MLSKKLNAALNKQMNKEFFSSYNYLAYAAYFQDEELSGFAHFFKVQAEEELQHAMKIFDYIHRVGGQCQLDPIAAPKRDFKGVVEPFESGLKNEGELAGDISELLQLATTEHHAPTQVFLQWFINEQVEEEALFTHCVKRLQRVATDNNGILRLDTEFSGRMGEGKGKPESD